MNEGNNRERNSRKIITNYQNLTPPKVITDIINADDEEDNGIIINEEGTNPNI